MNTTTRNISSADLPGLYGAADSASLRSQSSYFFQLACYLFLLVCAAFVSFKWPTTTYGALASAALFLISLAVLISLKLKKPEDLWYNGRAVAESVKTRSWRWMMKAEPYEDRESDEIVSRSFVNDLKAILGQNRSLSHELTPSDSESHALTEKMREIRGLPLSERLSIYQQQRINDQSNWYASKSQQNKRYGRYWFWGSVLLHSVAIGALLFRIKEPAMVLPVEVIAAAAGAVITWVQAKKYNELTASYALAAHEIVLIKGEALSVKTEKEFSEFVIDSEAAFSREHTQWTARKKD